jgi:hypothetical protein
MYHIPNIKIERNAFCNDTKNDPQFKGWCKIDRVDYKIYCWFSETKSNVKYLSGSIFSDDKKGKISLFKNMSDNEKQPKLKGNIVLNGEKYNVSLWYKVVKGRKQFTGKADYYEQQIVPEKKPITKADLVEKFKNM